MKAATTGTSLILGLAVAAGSAGCSSTWLAESQAGIHHPLAAPGLPPPPPPATNLPPAPVEEKKDKEDSPNPPPAPSPATGPLELPEVLQSVEQHFPLLLAIEQERAIASGQRLAAEGAFDLTLRARGVTQGGTFPSDRFDVVAEQATPLYGATLFGGYRRGIGDFPVYYGDRQTAEGGEFRGGLMVPLLKDGPIDRRRATLRQAQITEALADPVVMRSRIDYFRAAARAYWNWVAAGEQYRVADALLRIARDRQAGLEEQLQKGQIAEFVVIDNRRLIVEREGNLITAERRFQQASFELSLYLRDPEGNPQLPLAVRLPRAFSGQEPPVPTTERLAADIETAYALRPELVRFALLKERVSVELKLAQNMNLPALNAAVAGAQDVGPGKKSTGILALDRSVIEGSLLFEVPLQRREAAGRARAAQATLAQLLSQERYARDQISTEVQDAVSNLDRTHERLKRAREEQRIARRVAELEGERFRKGQSNLLEVNLRELAAAGAEAKVIDALADYFRAQADYRAALGLDAQSGPPR